MAEDHRRWAEECLQGVLLEESDFLGQIFERVLQKMLEAQMTEHIGEQSSLRANPQPTRHYRVPRAAQRLQLKGFED